MPDFLWFNCILLICASSLIKVCYFDSPSSWTSNLYNKVGDVLSASCRGCGFEMRRKFLKARISAISNSFISCVLLMCLGSHRAPVCGPDHCRCTVISIMSAWYETVYQWNQWSLFALTFGSFKCWNLKAVCPLVFELTWLSHKKKRMNAGMNSLSSVYLQ